MTWKNKKKTKEYYKKYYLKNKAKYAQSKKINYWRKKALSLGEPNNIVNTATIEELQKLCKEHI
jgi:hypothetical protein